MTPSEQLRIFYGISFWCSFIKLIRNRNYYYAKYFVGMDKSYNKWNIISILLEKMTEKQKLKMKTYVENVVFICYNEIECVKIT